MGVKKTILGALSQRLKWLYVKNCLSNLLFCFFFFWARAIFSFLFPPPFGPTNFSEIWKTGSYNFYHFSPKSLLFIKELRRKSVVKNRTILYFFWNFSPRPCRAGFQFNKKGKKKKKEAFLLNRVKREVIATLEVNLGGCFIWMQCSCWWNRIKFNYWSWHWLKS